MTAPLARGLAAWLILLPTLLFGDTVTLSGGERKTGRILGVEQEVLLLSSQPVPGLPAVDLRLSKSRITAIEFEGDPKRDEFVRNAGPAQLPEVKSLWERFAPLLPIPGSPSARIGLRYGLLLLDAKGDGVREASLALFEKIATAAPTPPEREAAAQGVLRSLLADRQWARAETEASAICQKECGTPLLAEARLTIGMVQAAKLVQFTELNPRWREDDFARPERDRMHEAALDGLLGAALLPGVPGDLAARGLRWALDVYALAGDQVRAREVAGDLASFYADTVEAKAAVEWLNANPERAGSNSK